MRKRIPSKGEIEAWKQLRMLRDEGFAFRREHKHGRYFADFVCLRRKLIVEVDGPLHESDEARKHDKARDAWLSAEGFVVIRFKDRDILSSRSWLREVREALQRQPEFGYRQRSPHPLPPPPLGEGGEREPC
jgi:5-methyltetrahydrofolate--homocysteine methyltransferase